jgi:hypothetical protein
MGAAFSTLLRKMGKSGGYGGKTDRKRPADGRSPRAFFMEREKKKKK